MSALTNALDRIRAWLQTNYPAAAADLSPGLTWSRLEETFRPLPFSLPQEVYELYQWSSGYSEESITNHGSFAPYEGMTLYSPEKGMEIAPNFEDEYDELKVRYAGKSLFPIFGFEIEYLCGIGNWEDGNTSPIVYVSEINEVALRYVSLTSMLLTAAECFETGVVYVDAQGFIHCDEERFSSIHQKYNSRLPELAVAGLKQELALAGADRYLLCGAWERFYYTFSWLTGRLWKDLSIEQFSSELVELIANSMEHGDEIVIRYPRMILEELKYAL